MDLVCKLKRQEERREYFVNDNILCRAIIKEAESSLEVKVTEAADKVNIHLDKEHSDIDYRISPELYHKIKKRILKIKEKREVKVYESTNK